MKKLNKTRNVALLAALSANLIWGLSGFSIKLALEDLQPNTYIFARFGLVALLLLPWAVRYFPRKLAPKKWGLLMLAAIVAGPLNYFLVVHGLYQTNLSSASLILFAEPVIVFLLAAWLLQERLNTRMKLGLMTALVGAGSIIVGSAGLNIAGVSLLGNALIFTVILFSALELIISKQIMKNVSPQFLLWAMAFTTTLTSMAFLSPTDAMQQLSNMSSLGVAGLGWGVLANTIIGYYCYFFALHTLKAGEVGILRYIDPIIGVMVGFLLLGEAFSVVYVVGGIIIGSGIYIVEYKKQSKRQRHKEHKLRHHRPVHKA